MNVLQSSSCEAAGEKAEVGQEDPCGCAGDRCLEVFGEAAAAAEPGEGALDHPSPGEEVEAFDAGRALNDLNRPGAASGDRALQLRAAIDTVGEDMIKLGKVSPQRTQQRHRAMRVLDVGFMHQNGEQKALCVGDNMALAPFDTLAGIDAARSAAFRCRRALAIDD